MRLPRSALLSLAALAFACSEPAGLLDAGVPADAGRDAGPTDSGGSDTSIALDAASDAAASDATDAADLGPRDQGPSDADAADFGFDLDGEIPDVDLPDFGISFDGSIPDFGISFDGSIPDFGINFDGSIPDVSFGDGGPTVTCSSASDCSMLRTPNSVMACPTSNWSCITGSCVWECGGGRTCSPDMSGCFNCGATNLGCAGDPCASGLVPTMLEDATCARDFLNPPPAICFGGLVLLSDLTVCTIEVLPTGAQRSVLACGGCQTQFTW